MSIKFSERADGVTIGLVGSNTYGVRPEGIGTTQIANASVTEAKLAFELPTGGSAALHGTTAPSNGLGNDGDTYLRTTNGAQYVKAEGSWTLLYTPQVVNPTSFAVSPYLAAGAGEDAWSFDARLTSEPDLGVAGWTVQLQNSPYTVLPRNGPVDMTQPYSPGGTYNSSFIGGVLALQLPEVGGAIQIGKATSGAFTYVMHSWAEVFSNGNSHYSFVSNGKDYDNGSNTFFFSGAELYSGDNNGANIEYLLGPGVSSQRRNVSLSPYNLNQIRYMNANGTTATNCIYIAAERSVNIIPDPNVQHDVPATTYAGIWVSHTSGRLVFLDFIRRRPFGSYP